MMIENYKSWPVWQKAHKLALEIYKVTEKFPKSEIFGLTSQLRRAGLSVPTNIVEGYARQNNKVFKTFLDTAYGSLAEVEYLLYFANEVGYLNRDGFKGLMGLTKETGGLLWKFREEVRRNAARQKIKL